MVRISIGALATERTHVEQLWRELREVVGYNWLRLRHRPLVEQLIARRRALAAEVMEALEATSRGGDEAEAFVSSRPD